MKPAWSSTAYVGRREIDAIAAQAAARRGLETQALIAQAIYAAIAEQNVIAADGETKH